MTPVARISLLRIAANVMVRKGAQQQAQGVDMAAEGTSCHNLRDQLAVDVGKPKVAAVEEVRQALVVQAQQME